MRVGALCMGYGGLELALSSLFDTDLRWYAEIDPHACKVLEARFPSVPNLGDLTTVDWSQVEPVDAMTAGYPCQPFSAAGARKGTDDERHLWPHIGSALRVLRPRYGFFENVRGHLSLGFDTVLADLAAGGFDAEWTLLRAADVGACHGRARLFVVAQNADGEPGHQRRGAAPRQAQGGRARPDAGERGGAPAPVAQGEQAGRVGQPRLHPRVPAAYADGVHEGAVPAGDRRGQPEGAARHCGDAAAHADDAAEHGQRPREVAGVGGQTSADAQGGGLEGRCESVGCDCGTAEQWASELARDGAGTAPDAAGDKRWVAYRNGRLIDYGPAIRRWERTFGWAAPDALAKGSLNPRFVEWMMGPPPGWVTDLLTSSQAKKVLGNGVVPQQAAAAFSHLLSRTAQEAAA